MENAASKLKLSSNPSIESIDAEIAGLVRDVAATKAAKPPAEDPSQKGQGKPRPSPAATAMVAISTVLCLGLTSFNLGLFSGQKTRPAPSPKDALADLDATLEVDVALLQSHFESNGSYPVDPEEAGLEVEGTNYQRISPKEFKLTLVDSGYAASASSKDLERVSAAEMSEALP